jgi:hypothetical protein
VTVILGTWITSASKLVLAGGAVPVVRDRLSVAQSLAAVGC